VEHHPEGIAILSIIDVIFIAKGTFSAHITLIYFQITRFLGHYTKTANNNVQET
jgi:hypothetical protein